MLILIWIYVASTITFAAREPYALYLTARSMNALGLIVPVFAAAGAWEGARLVQGGAWHLPAVRHRVAVAAWSVVPAVTGGLVVIVSAAMLVVTHDGVLAPEPIVLLAGGSILVGHVTLGFAIGTLLPRAVAVPLVLTGSFLCFVLPRVAGSAWLRHLSGTSIELCCTTDQSLDAGVVVTVLGGSLALVATAMLLVSWHGAVRSVRLLASFPPAAAIAFAVVISPPTVIPATVRAGFGDRCIEDGRVTVCLWPEHESMLVEVTRVAAEAVDIWTVAGVAVPANFREGQVGASDPSARLSVRSGSNRDDILADIAAAVIAPFPSEASGPDCAAGQPWPSAIAGPYVWTWLSSIAGMSPETLDAWFVEGSAPDSDYFPDTRPDAIVPVSTLVHRVLSMHPARQASWANRNIAAFKRCGVEAPLDLR